MNVKEMECDGGQPQPNFKILIWRKMRCGLLKITIAIVEYILMLFLRIYAMDTYFFHNFNQHSYM